MRRHSGGLINKERVLEHRVGARIDGRMTVETVVAENSCRGGVIEVGGSGGVEDIVGESPALVAGHFFVVNEEALSVGTVEDVVVIITDAVEEPLSLALLGAIVDADIETANPGITGTLFIVGENKSTLVVTAEIVLVNAGPAHVEIKVPSLSVVLDLVGPFAVVVLEEHVRAVEGPHPAARQAPVTQDTGAARGVAAVVGGLDARIVLDDRTGRVVDLNPVRTDIVDAVVLHQRAGDVFLGEDKNPRSRAVMHVVAIDQHIGHLDGMGKDGASQVLIVRFRVQRRSARRTCLGVIAEPLDEINFVVEDFDIGEVAAPFPGLDAAAVPFGAIKDVLAVKIRHRQSLHRDMVRAILDKNGGLDAASAVDGRFGLGLVTVGADIDRVAIAAGVMDGELTGPDAAPLQQDFVPGLQFRLVDFLNCFPRRCRVRPGFRVISLARVDIISCRLKTKRSESDDGKNETQKF